MRTSHFACIALVVTLFVATTSLADTFVSAHAGPSQTYDYDKEIASSERKVWEAGDYDWSYSLTASARAFIRGTGNPSGSVAWGDATAEVESPAGNDTASAYIQTSHEFDEDTDYDYVSGTGFVHTEGEEVVLTFDEESRASASCATSDPIQVYASGGTTVSGSIW